MPAIDQCHEQVVRALEKAGWQVALEPLTLETSMTQLFVDIQAERQANNQTERIIVVEVKCFPNRQSQTHDLYVAIGQYLVYRELIERLDISATLYLAIPTHAYHGIFKDIGLSVVQKTNIKLLVVDLEDEAVESWVEP